MTLLKPTEKPMEVIAEEAWAWMLYEEDKNLYLSVVCGSVGIYTIDFLLNEVEQTQYQNEGLSFISKLSSQVTLRPSLFQNRHLAHFDKIAGVTEASEEWRKKVNKK